MDDARGARLFDNWRAEKNVGEAFRVDASDTPELDGQGGPHGNGTLSDEAGRPLANTGHDYRLKNLFGWDLRGSRGIYSPEHHNKPFALAHDLLNDPRSPAELRTWFEHGGSGLPAYGSVLDDTDLDQLVAFVVKTRDGELARPEQIFRLDAAAPKHYALNPGGDAERGQARYAKACAECHGQDGRELVIDTTESVGTLGRTAGYEVWFKIAHGHPGTDMLRGVSEPSGEAQASAILDILAALCDRGHFPPQAVANAADVETGDLRCGPYLR